MLSIKFGFTAFGFSSDYNDEHAVIKFVVNIREMVSVMFIIFMSGQLIKVKVLSVTLSFL